MTGRRARAAAAAQQLNQLRRPPGVEVPAADDSSRYYRVDRFVLEVRDRFGFGAPRGEEYPITGWQSSVGDRAQDFEGGTIYLDTATGHAGFFSWRAYTPLAAGTADTPVAGAASPGGPGPPAPDGQATVP